METFDGKLAERGGLTYAMSVSEFLATPFNELAKIALPQLADPVGNQEATDECGSGETNRTTADSSASGIGSPTTCEDK